MVNVQFSISTMGGDGTDSPQSIINLLDLGEYEEYIAKLMNGMVNQTFHEKPISETTAIRMAHEILALLNHCGCDISEFKFGKFHELLSLKVGT